ncbi:MAG: LPXTG cell wall anchor domain-containing protein, partial [Microbacteriaceae bacterium]|nr:LPXTG cell wall anchor domain-containing protein [Microbacteriaceae bacterium]
GAEAKTAQVNKDLTVTIKTAKLVPPAAAEPKRDYAGELTKKGEPLVADKPVFTGEVTKKGEPATAQPKPAYDSELAKKGESLFVPAKPTLDPSPLLPVTVPEKSSYDGDLTAKLVPPLETPAKPDYTGELTKKGESAVAPENPVIDVKALLSGASPEKPSGSIPTQDTAQNTQQTSQTSVPDAQQKPQTPVSDAQQAQVSAAQQPSAKDGKTLANTGGNESRTGLFAGLALLLGGAVTWLTARRFRRQK